VTDGGSGPRFVLTRATDHTDAGPVEVPPPRGYPVEGQGQHDLMHELRWYLETYLDYPFEPWTTRATRLLAARVQWGRKAFDALFHGGLGRDFYTEATRGGEDQLIVEIRSDDPWVLSWPWEALENAKTSTPLALSCQFERRLTKLEPPPELDEGLLRDRLRILLVIARPYERDVGFRSVARPLIEQLESRSFPAEVTVLRPPTFERLQEVLEQNPGTFHILHFDGHGGYGSVTDGSGVPHQFKGPEGRLVFEDDHGQPAPVEASKLGTLLRRHKLPAVVLNACQAAMVDQHAEDAFASVAAALLRGGVRSVVAMAYSLYVSAAQVFLPTFYRRLFETGDIGRATQDGRRSMFERRERVCVRGRHPLEDWMIPVLYQQAKLDFSFVQGSHVGAELEQRRLPPAVDDSQNPYGFVGRDSTLLELERAMRRKPAGLLVHGLGGVGKTTLARGFVKWLLQTNGLGVAVLWVDFRDVGSAEYVVNKMLGPLAGTNALALSLAAKLEELKQLLNANAVLVVWDNFESARGIEGSLVEGSLPAEDQQMLEGLLRGLRGGKSKVLLTSRSEERWLGGPETCTRVLLGGLAGEERWTFCQRILDDLGLVVDRGDADQIALMDKLRGHPLLMRAVLPKLESMTAEAITKAVEVNLTAVVDGEDKFGAQVMATLGFVVQSLSDELVPLLMPLSLHEHFVDAADLEAIGAVVPGEWSRARIDALLRALSVAGLLTERAPELFEMHPALTTYLRTRVTGDDREEAWQRAFADSLSKMADAYAPRPLHEQRPVFRVQGANFRRALSLAKMLKRTVSVGALTQSLASYAHNTWDLATAWTLYEELAVYGAREDTEVEASAYHQLGRVALLRREFDVAERWCRKSLAIKEAQENEHGAAITYRLLGSIALAQRDFDAAERWHQKALAISQKHEGEGDSVGLYRQLGDVALQQRDFVAAERCYRKSLAICKKQADEYEAAVTYHLLGNVALQQQNIDAAERWYGMALAIFEKCGAEDGSAGLYHQLGMVTHEQQKLEIAERWYRKSLSISEKQGNEHGAATTYHQLGRVAEEQEDVETAERWYRKALAICEKLADEHGAALAYHHLGIMVHKQRNFDVAERWYRKALAIFEKQGDEHGAAGTYHGLGMLAQERLDFDTARSYFIRAATAFARSEAPHEFGIVAQVVVSCHDVTPEPSKSELRKAWEAAGLEWPTP
jgi:tetratricopeptide (TPR) repeat protein